MASRHCCGQIAGGKNCTACTQHLHQLFPPPPAGGKMLGNRLYWIATRIATSTERLTGHLTIWRTKAFYTFSIEVISFYPTTVKAIWFRSRYSRCRCTSAVSIFLMAGWTFDGWLNFLMAGWTFANLHLVTNVRCLYTLSTVLYDTCTIPAVGGERAKKQFVFG